ncbi:putative GTP pyrophosphokinase [Nocardioides massiliensis]|uniref:GTP pyrophosphokinase n=1 Tax=Nocardioides massiliensis TaxID=1325935 RepID=A0ABT9NRV7_9ACTN|nr:putative GTP pyrophosphokinase [Nocardioides massiliensis]
MEDASSTAMPSLDDLVQLRAEFSRFMLQYQFGIEEVKTKIEILRLEFIHLHAHNPIEHVAARLKSSESLIAKVSRKGLDPSFEAISASITDIAGLRIVCSFVSDVYRVAEMLSRQSDITVLETKDYISAPKPNGYRSLHLLVQVPVFLSDETLAVTVELQLRTVAMDFWASLEHKIHYKYDHHLPTEVRKDLEASARTAAELDTIMEHLHQQVHGDGESAPPRRGSAIPTDAVLAQFLRIRAARSGPPSP